MYRDENTEHQTDNDDLKKGVKMDLNKLKDELSQMGLLVRKLEEWAETRPDKVFFYYGEENSFLTYKEFNRRANCIAHNLQAIGVKKGDRVCLYLQNPLVTLQSMVAIWKLGAVYCPINFLYKGRLLSFQIADTQPRLLITENGRETILNQIELDINGIPVVVHYPEKEDHDYKPENAALKLSETISQTAFSDLLTGDHSNPGIELSYWDTANIIYTSGTTGPPKGVVQSHRWLQNYCYYGVKLLHPDDVVYCDLPLYHIGGVFSLVGRAAWKGCTVAVWDRFSASEFWNRINTSQASYCLLLDVMMPWLMQAEEQLEDRNNTLRRAHMQPLPEYHYSFARRFGLDFVNVGYGATEIGYGCAAMIDESVGGAGSPEEYRNGFSNEEIIEIARQLGMPVVPGNSKIKKGYMGKPCTQHEVTILDEKDEELAPGEYGQIALRGRLPYLLLNEYFNRQDASLKVFKNFWFHTGDGAYRDRDGIFYFVDRMGGFIRVKGENISSFQIEDIMNTHPKIAVSAAFPIQAEQGLEDDIVVYIVNIPGAELTEVEVESWIEKEIPRYMRPKYIRFIDELPQTPTHKVEKYKLKEMFLEEMQGVVQN